MVKLTVWRKFVRKIRFSVCMCVSALRFAHLLFIGNRVGWQHGGNSMIMYVQCVQTQKVKRGPTKPSQMPCMACCKPDFVVACRLLCSFIMAKSYWNYNKFTAFTMTKPPKKWTSHHRKGRGRWKGYYCTELGSSRCEIWCMHCTQRHTTHGNVIEMVVKNKLLLLQCRTMRACDTQQQPNATPTQSTQKSINGKIIEIESNECNVVADHFWFHFFFWLDENGALMWRNCWNSFVVEFNFNRFHIAWIRSCIIFRTHTHSHKNHSVFCYFPFHVYLRGKWFSLQTVRTLSFATYFENENRTVFVDAIRITLDLTERQRTKLVSVAACFWAFVFVFYLVLWIAKYLYVLIG